MQMMDSMQQQPQLILKKLVIDQSMVRNTPETIINMINALLIQKKPAIPLKLKLMRMMMTITVATVGQ